MIVRKMTPVGWKMLRVVRSRGKFLASPSARNKWRVRIKGLPALINDRHCFRCLDRYTRGGTSEFPEVAAFRYYMLFSQCRSACSAFHYFYDSVKAKCLIALSTDSPLLCSSQPLAVLNFHPIVPSVLAVDE